ncbi:MAG: CARDB domain-containing protein [Euryarchaeota archaeon]|nr:CARDB domain-containing protein [Euryarchaeota archaeon]
MCDTARNYCDASAECPPPCVYQCPGAGPDLVISDFTVEWDDEPTTYNITYTVKNVGRQSTGGNTSNTSVTADGTPVTGSPFFCPALDSVSGPNNSNTTTVGPFTLTTPHDTIVVCADSLSQVTEPGYGDEDNNCKTDVFGAPDLVITHFWTTTPSVNDSYKRYDLTYTVENVGDRATPAQCWTNFTELHGEWSGCVDPVPIPAGLAKGDPPVTHIVGPFVLGGDHDWVQAWVNFNHTFPENVEDDLHGNRARFCPECSGSACGCNICGDVDGNTLINIDDGKKAAKGQINTCNWAADVDCNHLINIDDGKRIAKGQLSCCDPGPLPGTCL